LSAGELSVIAIVNQQSIGREKLIRNPLFCFFLRAIYLIDQRMLPRIGSSLVGVGSLHKCSVEWVSSLRAGSCSSALNVHISFVVCHLVCACISWKSVEKWHSHLPSSSHFRVASQDFFIYTLVFVENIPNLNIPMPPFTCAMWVNTCSLNRWKGARS